ncbi:MAG: ABC transporter permease [Polaromonas sp.]
MRATTQNRTTVCALAAVGVKHLAVVCTWMAIFLSVHETAYAQQNSGSCGSLQNGVGPYDYRTDQQQLEIVYRHHFTPIVESIIRGATNETAGPDIDYTLRAAPNHARALLAMMRLGEKEKIQQPRGSRYTVECWFDRAIRFRPDDNVVRMIYATFLAKNGRAPLAVEQLDRVAATAGDNAFTHYNAGLVYFDIKVYDKAVAQAHKAMALGLPRTELADQLKTAGKWVEPVAEMPAANAEQK